MHQQRKDLCPLHNFNKHFPRTLVQVCIYRVRQLGLSSVDVNSGELTELSQGHHKFGHASNCSVIALGH